MRFLKTFFRFFTITILCTTFTIVAWGTDCQTNIIQADTCNKHEGCYNNEGWGKSNCHECPVGNKCPYSTSSSKNPTPCNNGKYQDATGQAGCKTCPAGKMTPNDTNAYTSCTTCTTGKTSSAGSSSCTACTNGPIGRTYFGYAANAGGSCPWRSNKCVINQYFDISTNSCTNCDANQHNYLWTTTSATNLCWDGKTNSSTVYLCNTSNAQVSFPTGFDSSDIFNCEYNKYTIKVYIQYNGNTSYVSEFTYSAADGGRVTTESNHYIADPVNSYISKSLKNKYTLTSTTYYLYQYFANIANNAHIGSYLYLQGNTLYLDKPSNVQGLPDGTTLYAVVPLTGVEYKVYMLSASTNSGIISANDTERNIAVNTTKTVTKHFGDTPSDNVSPNTNNVSKCNNTFYGYIADTATPEYYECTISGSNATIQLSTKQTTMFEPSEGGKHICVGYTHTACEAGYSCSSCVRTACAKGTYQDATGQSSCEDCVAGKKTGVNGTGATTCSDCDAGTYSKGAANALCTSCAVGTYQDTTGATSCEPCSTGTYQDTTGQSSCKSCSKQTNSKYPSSASGSDSISDCYLTLTDGKYVLTAGGGAQDCPAGSYCSKSGTTVYQGSPNSPTTAAVSGQCAVGTYSGTGQTSCLNCVAGKKTGVSGTGATTCSDCDAGTYSSGAANATCTPCAAGTYQNATGQSSCDTCSAGTYSAAGKSNCEPCPIGTYQGNGGQSSCISCQDGQTSTTTESSGLFTTENTGTETRNECYLNPDLTLTDSIPNASGVTLNSLSGGNKIFYVGP